MLPEVVPVVSLVPQRLIDYNNADAGRVSDAGRVRRERKKAFAGKRVGETVYKERSGACLSSDILIKPRRRESEFPSGCGIMPGKSSLESRPLTDGVFERIKEFLIEEETEEKGFVGLISGFWQEMEGFNSQELKELVQLRKLGQLPETPFLSLFKEVVRNLSKRELKELKEIRLALESGVNFDVGSDNLNFSQLSGSGLFVLLGFSVAEAMRDEKIKRSALILSLSLLLGLQVACGGTTESLETTVTAIRESLSTLDAVSEALGFDKKEDISLTPIPPTYLPEGMEMTPGPHPKIWRDVEDIASCAEVFLLEDCGVRQERSVLIGRLVELRSSLEAAESDLLPENYKRLLDLFDLLIKNEKALDEKGSEALDSGEAVLIDWMANRYPADSSSGGKTFTVDIGQVKGVILLSGDDSFAHELIHVGLALEREKEGLGIMISNEKDDLGLSLEEYDAIYFGYLIEQVVHQPKADQSIFDYYGVDVGRMVKFLNDNGVAYNDPLSRLLIGRVRLQVKAYKLYVESKVGNWKDYDQVLKMADQEWEDYFKSNRTDRLFIEWMRKQGSEENWLDPDWFLPALEWQD